jgi:hypothetical protein
MTPPAPPQQQQQQQQQQQGQAAQQQQQSAGEPLVAVWASAIQELRAVARQYAIVSDVTESALAPIPRTRDDVTPSAATTTHPTAAGRGRGPFAARSVWCCAGWRSPA